MYEEYLCALLEPLRVYDLRADSINRAELHALGAEMDGVAGRLETAEREALVATAEDEGLRRMEKLFARRGAAVTVEERRRAIAALVQISGDSLTPEAINRTVIGCGIAAEVLEQGGGQLRVIFPEVYGIPADFGQIEKIVLDILPCHLAVEFFFRYLTWAECEQAGYTWATVEAAGYTWERFQVAIP